MLYGSFWAFSFDKENSISSLLALSGAVPLARIFPLTLIVTANEVASLPPGDKVIGIAPAIWVYVTGASIIILAGYMISSKRYGRIAGAQRKARRGVAEVDGIGKLPPGGTTDWLAM